MAVSRPFRFSVVWWYHALMTHEPTKSELLSKAYKEATNDRAKAWAAGNKADIDIAEKRIAEIQNQIRLNSKP